MENQGNLSKIVQKMNFWLWKMLIFRQKFAIFQNVGLKIVPKFLNFSKFCLKNVIFLSWKLKIENWGGKKWTFRSEKCGFFVKKLQIFQKKCCILLKKLLILQEKKLKLSQNLSKVSEKNQDFCCRKNLNFQWKREKISKNLSKIVRFCRKKVKDFSKIVKSVRKNLKFPSLFFQKAWIFSGKPKNFELFLLKKWIFFVKICQQWQFWAWKNFRNFAFFRKKKMKDFQQKP